MWVLKKKSVHSRNGSARPYCGPIYFLLVTSCCFYFEVAMPRRKKTDVVTLHLRLREELRAQLAREADKKKTSINAEIVPRLEDSFRGDVLVGTVRSTIQTTFNETIRLNASPGGTFTLGPFITNPEEEK